MFGLKGACLSIDTACSSSLVGAHYGAAGTAAGDCTRALVAGVNLTLSPGKTSAFAVTGLITTETTDASIDHCYYRATSMGGNCGFHAKDDSLHRASH